MKAISRLALIPLFLCLLGPRSALAEGTWQIGANHDLYTSTLIGVDILTVGEVINISVGKDIAPSTSTVTVNVKDPSGAHVTGSPFSVGYYVNGRKGYLYYPHKLPPATITNALQVVTKAKGKYTVQFASGLGWVDPFDITVTPTTTTPVKPGVPALPGRVFSQRWSFNANSYTNKNNARVYILTPVSGTTDFTWLLQFNGLAGYTFDLAANSMGLPSPKSGMSEKKALAKVPQPEFDLYLNVPAKAKGGTKAPVLSQFAFAGKGLCTKALPGMLNPFTFTSDSVATYQLIIDTDGDGVFNPTTDKVLLTGKSKVGASTVSWSGKTSAGLAVKPGSYKAQLSLRQGELHFVADDIETSNPGLRFYRVDPPAAATVPASAKMFWDDTKINTFSTLLISPASTLPYGLDSGTWGAKAVCSKPGQTGANAHCWGNFGASGPGNNSYIDTWAYAYQTVATLTFTVGTPAADDDSDGLTNLAECRDHGTDPTKKDTDGDGLDDKLEVSGKTSPTNKDTDGDGLDDGVEDANKNGKVDVGETKPNNSDTDGDGISDGVEDKNKNGKTDAGETDPTKKDTDGDGLDDGVEDSDKDGVVDAGETDPTKKDTDGDGILDGVEDANKNGKVDAGETDPAKKDTDGDGLDDGVEDANKNGKVNKIETDPTKKDTDGDGLDDGVEDKNKNATVDTGETNPLKKDTDGDGLSDGIEDADKDGAYDKGIETNPLSTDTDLDGLVDGWVDANKDNKKTKAEGEDLDLDGVVDKTETDPRLADTDKGGESDGSEVLKTNHDPLDPKDDFVDTDGDGIVDKLEDKNGNGKVDPGETDPKKKDTDGDGIPDGVEDANKNGKVDTGESDPTKNDTDGDGLLDSQEDKNKNGKKDKNETDSTLKDTDGDGIDDGVEDANKNGKVDPSESDPRKKDTDSDGIPDGLEDANKNGKLDAGETDPTRQDTDGDGLTDSEEDRNKNGKQDKGETDPTLADTDADGLNDGLEDADKDGTFDLGIETDALNKDTDGDGLLDGWVDTNNDKKKTMSEGEDLDLDGVVDKTETDPKVADTDKGGESDGSEVLTTKNDPLDPSDDYVDTDKDGIVDKLEDKNKNGKVDPGETDPKKQDTDGDGIPDGVEDANKNGKVDAGETDPTKKDTDGDGIADGLEDLDKDGTLDKGETDPLKKDTDGDGLGDGAEDANKNGKVDKGETDPTKKDTDGGGEEDGKEVTRGSDPLDPTDDITGTVDDEAGCALGGGRTRHDAGILLLLGLMLLTFRRCRRWGPRGDGDGPVMLAFIADIAKILFKK